MKRLLMLGMTVLMLLSALHLHAAEFVEIGSRFGFSFLRRISADGQFVVGETAAEEAFIWSRETGFMTLGTLPRHLYSFARDVSGDGSVVVGDSDSHTFASEEPFLWTEESGMIRLGRPPGFSHNTIATAISDDGLTVVGNAQYLGPPGVTRVPFRWTAHDGMVSLGLPSGADDAIATDISADGSLIAVGAINSGSGAFIWDEESGFQDLAPLPPGWRDARPARISADGSTVIGVANLARQLPPWGDLFRWTREEGVHPIPGLPGANAGFAGGLSEDGSVIVGTAGVEVPSDVDPSVTRFESPQAFVWDKQHGTRDLRQLLIREHGFSDQELPALRYANDLSSDTRTILGSSGLRGQLWAIYLDKPLVTFGLPGDYNNNGLVEQQDLDLVLGNWGQSAATPPALWTNYLPTGNIDQDELDRVLGNWGNTTAAVETAAVPEPSSAALILVLGIVAMALRHGRTYRARALPRATLLREGRFDNDQRSDLPGPVGRISTAGPRPELSRNRAAVEASPRFSPLWLCFSSPGPDHGRSIARCSPVTCNHFRENHDKSMDFRPRGVLSSGHEYCTKIS